MFTDEIIREFILSYPVAVGHRVRITYSDYPVTEEGVLLSSDERSFTVMLAHLKEPMTYSRHGFSYSFLDIEEAIVDL